MTTLMMPSDYGVEMFLGSSPVLTSGYLGPLHEFPRFSPLTPPTSSPIHGFWGSGGQSCAAATVNANNVNNTNTNASSFRSFTCPTVFTVAGLAPKNFSSRSSVRKSKERKKVEALNLHPIKSCLVARQEEGEPEGAISPTRLKKKVVFADTQGHPLTEVRVLTERPDCPPRWTPDFLEQVTGGAKAEALADQWELAFPQPASDYLGMKARLERDNVCLENAVIQETQAAITGTIKVRNLSFHKSVQVRYTINNWASYDDVEATFMPSLGSASSASYDIYDTFSFTLPLPVSSQADKMEFCICFSSEVGEYWDNNNSKNYVIVSFRPKAGNKGTEETKPKDVYDVEIDAWSEFASWNHLNINDSPYW